MGKSTNLFGQIIGLLHVAGFDSIVRKHKGDKHAKGFSAWDQCVCMLYCHLMQATSLREICGGLATISGKINHLGLKKPPKRSTLAYANEHKPAAMFFDLFTSLHGLCAGAWKGKRRFRFKSKLYILDSTIIDLCVKLFPWAKYRTTKGAVKVHMLLDDDGCLPMFATISEGRKSDIHAARDIAASDLLPKGSIIVFDRGYNDYELFRQWSKKEITFVTRMKDGTLYKVTDTYAPPQHSKILCDENIELTGHSATKEPMPVLRRVVVWDEVNQKEIVLLTNNTVLGSTTIAEIYKERWQIEIFFKTIKQHLRIKAFVGESVNAVHIQIWTALCAILLLKYLKFKSMFNWSLSNLIALLRPNMFTYRDLQHWLDNPFESPPIEPSDKQLELGF